MAFSECDFLFDFCGLKCLIWSVYIVGKFMVNKSLSVNNKLMELKYHKIFKPFESIETKKDCTVGISVDFDSREFREVYRVFLFEKLLVISV